MTILFNNNNNNSETEILSCADSCYLDISKSLLDIQFDNDNIKSEITRQTPNTINDQLT
jgi:hypothetical protein